MTGVTIIKRTVISNPLRLVRKYNTIKVTAQVPVLTRQIFRSFYLIATAGQTTFTLPSYCIANGMVFLAVNGTGQSPIRGDFSVTGNQLIMGSALDAGDEVIGTYEQE